MRHIRFRVWSKEYESFYLIDFAQKFNWASPMKYLDGRFELQQYTGLQDKDGRGIYEGDLLVVWDGDKLYDKFPFTVVYCSRFGEYKLAAANPLSYYLDRGYKFEVIGNNKKHTHLLNTEYIHENQHSSSLS